MSKIADIRKDYKLETLLETNVANNPIDQFTFWWKEATDSAVDEINAMTLCTATADGTPSGRIVLLKGYDEKGFVFFGNYESNKGIELAQNPKASLVFFWKELERQIRIKGTVEKLSDADNDEYYHSRPEGSRIGAWASPQSAVIENREVLQQNVEKYQQQFSNSPITRPTHWGGYLVKPTVVEFWQGRPSRLHDRIQYTLQTNGSWKIDRLAP